LKIRLPSLFLFKLIFSLCLLQSLESHGQSADSSLTAQPTDSNVILMDSVLNNSIGTDSTKKKRNPELSKNAIESTVKYSARDSIRFSVDLKEIYLYGEAKVNYEKIVLTADYIKIDQQNFIVYAKGRPDSSGKIIGKPVFKEGESEYKSNKMSYNFKTQKGKIKKVTTQEGEGYLLSQDVKYIRKGANQDILYGYKNKYTTCNLDSPHYYIAITKSKILGKQIISGPAYMVIEEVPLPLVLPFGFFPKKNGQVSGILIPEIGERNDLGFFLSGLGIYWGINKNYDLTLRSDIYSKGSFNTNGNFRYKERYKYSGNLDLRYGEIRTGIKNTPEFNKTKDFNIRWSHTQDSKARPGVNFSANVNAGSSSYLKNYSRDIDNLATNTLQSSISYSKAWKNTPFRFTGALNHNQNTQSKIVNLTLPRAEFNVNRINPFENKNRIGQALWYEDIGFTYTARGENRLSRPDSLLFASDALSHVESGISHSIPLNKTFKLFKYFNITPRISYNEEWHFKTISKSWVPIADTDSGFVRIDTLRGFKTTRTYSTGASLTTNIYGMLNVNALGIKAIRHVLRPSIGFSYRPDYGEERFGYWNTIQSDKNGGTSTYSIFEGSFLGSPSRGKSSVVTFGLNNNVEMKVKSASDTITGTKKLKIFESLNLNTSYNLVADSMKLRPFSLTARTTLFERININFLGTLNPYALDSNNRTYDQFTLNTDGSLARLTNARLTFSGNLNPSAKKPEPEKDLTEEEIADPELRYYLNNPSNYVDFNIPWSLNFTFTMNYSKPAIEPTITQTLNLTGDVKLTNNWKIGYTTGYNFENKEVTGTSLNIYRDLHCWDMAIRWIPFGPRQFYSIDLKVKASILQDLKVSKKSAQYF
jgi:lipopolysaccharide assembly outer membrane protein LptD (OstA)